MRRPGAGCVLCCKAGACVAAHPGPRTVACGSVPLYTWAYGRAVLHTQAHIE